MGIGGQGLSPQISKPPHLNLVLPTAAAPYFHEQEVDGGRGSDGIVVVTSWKPPPTGKPEQWQEPVKISSGVRLGARGDGCRFLRRRGCAMAFLNRWPGTAFGHARRVAGMGFGEDLLRIYVCGLSMEGGAAARMVPSPPLHTLPPRMTRTDGSPVSQLGDIKGRCHAPPSHPSSRPAPSRPSPDIHLAAFLQ